ncbi:hypothetical protein Tco_1260160, partial [Tanacetum coccineum]
YSSSSDSDSSEDSLPPAPDLPLVSPFLCYDDSEADGESEPAEQRSERYKFLTPSSEFPLAHVVAPPGIHRWQVICTDNANIARKWSKPDKHEHRKGKSVQKSGI